MALIKIFTRKKNLGELKEHVAYSVKMIGAAVLDTPECEAAPSSIETVYVEGLDLVGIDYILEIIAIERENQQKIAELFIKTLHEVYPDKLFSVYFNIISENGMANTPRPELKNQPITIKDAVAASRDRIAAVKRGAV
jgi:hypothetical protein